ncbi:HtaA domain-containing protein [Nesterenkonia populi]
MNFSKNPPPPLSRQLLRPAIVACGIGVLAFGSQIPASAAPAAEAPEITGYEAAEGSLTWAVHDSFTRYIQGPIARGGWESWDVEDDGGSFTWSNGTGELPADQESGSISYEGGVHYTGHVGYHQADEPGLSIEVENPTIEWEGDEGTLYLDVESLDLDENILGGDQVPFASLSFTDLSVEQGSVAGTAEAELTAEGAEAFAGFYEPGEQMEPISFEADLAQVEAQDPEEPAAEADPALSVAPSQDLDPDGQTLTILGEGFGTDYAAPSYMPFLPSAGLYVQIGWIDETWRPSEGASSDARSNAYTVWVQGGMNRDGFHLWEENDDGTADFTWEVDVDQETLDEVAREDATLAVFTVGAGGVQEVNELAVPITFAEIEDEPAPTEEPTQTAEPSPEPTQEPTDEPTDTQEPTEAPTPSEPATPGETPTESPSPSRSPHPSTDSPEEPEAVQPVGVISLSANEVEAGGTVRFEAEGFDPGEDVTAAINPQLGTFQTDADGTVTGEVTIPEDLEPGEHTLTLTGQESGVVATIALTVLDAADTGAESRAEDEEDAPEAEPAGSASGESTEEEDESGALSADKGEALASTGATSAAIALISLTLVALGGVLLARRRRGAPQTS